MELIDIHTHLNMLEEDLEQILAKSLENKVKRMITVSTKPEDFNININLSQKFFQFVWCTIGFHPHDAKLFNSDTKQQMEKLLKDSKVVAIGEIGLDYYYKYSSIEEQKTAFAEQLKLAQKYNLPIEVHSRDAQEDTLNILKEISSPQIKGVFHCFTGNWEMAKICLDLGFDISFSGIITFKKADELRNIAKKIPLERIHIETDAPFLTPHPYRNQKNNPSMLKYIACCMAEIKNISEYELSKSLMNNALKLFSKIH